MSVLRSQETKRELLQRLNVLQTQVQPYIRLMRRPSNLRIIMTLAKKDYNYT